MADQEKKVVSETIVKRKAADSKVVVDATEVQLSASGTAGDEAPPKRKYSRRFADVQRFERNVSRGLQRLARSVEAGIREWREATDRSSRKRRDGAIRDALDNSARALGKQLRVASRAPEDAVRAVRSLKIAKAVRRVFPL